MRSWNMLYEMNGMHHELDKLFGTGFGRSVLMPEVAPNTAHQLLLTEDRDNYFVEAVLPGIDVKDLEMNATGNLLTLSVNRTESDTNSDQSWHRRERNIGSFARTIKLQTEIDSQRAEATYQDGILKITLPKVEAAKPKRIEIKTA